MRRPHGTSTAEPLTPVLIIRTGLRLFEPRRIDSSTEPSNMTRGHLIGSGVRHLRPASFHSESQRNSKRSVPPMESDRILMGLALLLLRALRGLSRRSHGHSDLGEYCPKH